MAAGATARRVAKRMGISLRTLQRWRRQFAACAGGRDGHGRCDGGDRRKGSARHVPHRLSEQERQEILAVCNQPQYASLPPAQIVPDLADQGRYLASESSFYRVLHAHQQVQRRGRPGRRRPQGRYQGAGLMDPISPGAGTSPTCREECAVSGCTSTWWWTCGAARSWPGTSMTGRRPSRRPS